MNKKILCIFIALVFLVTGYALVTATFSVNSEVIVAFDEADFNIFFSKIADGNNLLGTISEDGDSFTYDSTGNNMVGYTILNRSVKYNAIVDVTCDHDVVVNQEEDVVLGGTVINGTISSDYVGCITCNLNSTAVARNENSEAPYNVHTLIMNPNEGSIDITEFYFVEGEPIGKLPTPIKEGYNFVGWFNQSEGITEGLEEITEDKVYSDIDDVTIYAHYEQAGVNLFNLIKDQAKSDTIDFSVHSGTSGTNGVYITTETEGNVPVYYFRGSHEGVNNNLIFNNMCWKIIRTTETGGVKIIYNGTPTNGQCTNTTGTSTQIGTSQYNTNYNDNAYVGYMYGTAGSSTYEATHANTNNSKIKTYIEDWYSNNFTGSGTAKLEDTVFCNDRSTVSGGNNNSLGTSYGTLGYGQNYTGYGALARSSYYTLTLKPSLACPQANDKFTVSSTNGNGKLTYPVGLITLDELILAGFNTYKSNTSDYRNTTNYLYTNQYYWTFSPVYARANAFVGHVNSAGDVEDNNGVSATYGVRPVVSLADGTLVCSDGEGTSAKPYVVS